MHCTEHTSQLTSAQPAEGSPLDSPIKQAALLSVHAQMTLHHPISTCCLMQDPDECQAWQKPAHRCGAACKGHSEIEAHCLVLRRYHPAELTAPDYPAHVLIRQSDKHTRPQPNASWWCVISIIGAVTLSHVVCTTRDPSILDRE